MNEKLNIQDLVDILAEKHGMSKKNADSFVKEFFQLIEEALEKDKYVKVKGLGTFKLIDVESRESVNVNTGERFEIQGHTKVSFTPETTLKDIINKPFAHFETVVLNDNTVLEDTPVDSEIDDDDEGIAKEEPDIPSATSEEKAATVAEIPVISVQKEEAEKVEERIEEKPEERIEEKTEERIEEKAEVEAPATATKDSSTMKYFIGIVAFVVVLCAGAVAYLYSPDWFEQFTSQPPTEEAVDANADKPADKTIMTDSIVVKDTVQAVRVDTVRERTASAPVTSKERKKTVAVPFKPDSVGYTIVGTETTYTMQEGETLTKVALRFYGTKVLWPYIVKHNPGIIKNPDNVPYGTTIKIPKLAKKQ